LLPRGTLVGCVVVELRVGTWNCFGMGQGLDAVTHVRAPYGDRLRDRAVIEACAAIDVLCVQEILSREAQRFFDDLRAEYFASSIRDDNRVRLTDPSMRGSGLGIGARAALDRTLLRSFPGERVGWDRLARKGALYAQLALEGGARVDLVTAHLQAGYDERAGRVRTVQLAHLAALVDEVGSSDRPFIVCGDFNIDGLGAMRGQAPYVALRAALGGFEDLGLDEDLPTFHPKPDGNGLAYAFEPDGHDQRIDYIFFRPASAGPRLRVEGLRRFLDAPLAGTRLRGDQPAWASDHYGLSATFTLA
jgi:endonuclease/exonuclease/phosphatase family metal-dependent hydrolase